MTISNAYPTEPAESLAKNPEHALSMHLAEHMMTTIERNIVASTSRHQVVIMNKNHCDMALVHDDNQVIAAKQHSMIIRKTCTIARR